MSGEGKRGVSRGNGTLSWDNGQREELLWLVRGEDITHAKTSLL